MMRSSNRSFFLPGELHALSWWSIRWVEHLWRWTADTGRLLELAVSTSVLSICWDEEKTDLGSSMHRTVTAGLFTLARDPQKVSTQMPGRLLGWSIGPSVLALVRRATSFLSPCVLVFYPSSSSIVRRPPFLSFWGCFSFFLLWLSQLRLCFFINYKDSTTPFFFVWQIVETL